MDFVLFKKMIRSETRTNYLLDKNILSGTEKEEDSQSNFQVQYFAKSRLNLLK